MTRKLIFIAGMALVLAGCGDQDGADTSEPSMMDKAMDATKDTAGNATDAVKDTISDVVEGADDKVQDDATKEAIEYMDKEMEKAAESLSQ